MPHQETRVGYITFEGLDGPRRLFYFDEPLALGLLRVLERAAHSAGSGCTSGELDPSVHAPLRTAHERRTPVPGSLEDLERTHQAYVDALKFAAIEDIDAHVRANVGRVW